jgi:signal transduction histidine kinase
MVTVAIVPFCVLWFILNFTRSRFLNSRKALVLICIFPVIDVIAILTNPTHHFMFLNYSYPYPALGSGFWIHAVCSTAVFTFSFIVLIRYIFKYTRKEPLLILAGIGTFIPYVLNFLYTTGIRFMPHDITPLGFFITFILFAFSSYRSQMINMKALSFSSIFTLLKDVVLVVNDHGIIVDSSPAAITTFQDFSFISGQNSLENFFSYLNKKKIKCTPENILNPADAGMEQNGELRLRREPLFINETNDKISGTEMTFSITLRPMIVKNKNKGCILIMSDVSVYHSMISEINEKNVRLEELTKAAEAASVAKSAFLANMSHEIRTPLNAVIGMTLIARKSAVNEKNLTSIEAIEKKKKHLLGILNDVLDMSKKKRGKFELINEKKKKKIVMDEVNEIIRQRCTEKNINLDTTFSDKKDIFIQGDHLRLKQVFINLLGNAVKFTPDNGIINFSMNIIEENEKKIKIHFIVSDNGIGMTEDQLGRLFQTFSQAD